jgi:hypothetical protein
VFFAYPGIPYNIRAVVIAGAFPYTFALSNAPSGMTINASTGEINWPNPQANASPTITVTDAEGTSRSSSWDIAVTTTGFRFVDSARGDDANAGTLASPWRTFARVKAAAVSSDIVYFRAGTYNTDGMPIEDQVSTQFQPAGNWQGVVFEGNNPTRFIAYPGETVIYDGGYVANQRQGNILRIGGNSRNPVYIEGFQMRNMWHMGIQFASGTADYVTFRKLAFDGPRFGIDGANSSALMTTSSLTDPTWYAAYSELSQVNGGPGLIKQYSHKKGLWEDCRVNGGFGGPDQKMHVVRFEVRGCRISGTTNGEQGGLFGNMQFGSGGQGETSSGEFRFNFVDRRGAASGAIALDLNQNADSGPMNVYRNTFLGRVRVRNADTGDGPFNIYNNVIVNSDSGSPSGSHIYHEDVNMPSRIVLTNNVVGFPADNVVNTAGELTGDFARFIGTRGHQISNVPRPSPATNTNVQ